MVEVLFPPVTRRARNKNKSEMNRCLPIWLSRPTSHQPRCPFRKSTASSNRYPVRTYDTRSGEGLTKWTSSLEAVGGTHGVSPYRYYVLWWSILVLWGSILRVFLSIGQGKSLPRSGISPENTPPILCIFPLCRAATGERQEEFLNP